MTRLPKNKTRSKLSNPSAHTHMLPFKSRLTVEERRQECVRIRNRRPGFVPVIVERASPSTPALDKEKYLIPNDLTAAQLVFVLRRRLCMKSSEALFLSCGGKVVAGTTTIQEICHKNQRASEDGFLYMTYALENAFG